MAQTNITTEEADAILAEPKLATGNVVWQSDGRGYRMKELLVLCTESGKTLKIRGRVGVRHRSFVLLYKDKRIRGWDSEGRHRNPDRLVIDGQHKHRWDTDHEDSFAYVPNDIPSGTPESELRGFLEECNIEYTGAIQSIGLGH